MKTLIENLANLFKIKNVISIAAAIVFVAKSIDGTFNAEQVLAVIILVFGFYFSRPTTPAQ